ncbi:MAG: TetR family transcriptional regulator [Moraxellaceae bacterium]|nr:MAG: TetR family transcriptional regulator [Moraxellaceae bacterium]
MARTKAFDPEEKLTLAMMQFWHHGYDGTSIQGLVDTMGINRFSIYNTFGDKDALFFKSLQHYSVVVFDPLLLPLQSDAPGLERIQAYFLHFVDKLTRVKIKAGCFLQNAVQEAAVTNPEVRPYVASLFDRLRKGFYAALNDAHNANELARLEDIEGGTEFLLMQVQALLALHRQESTRTLKSNVNFLLAEVQSW